MFQRLRVLFGDDDWDGQDLACIVQLCCGEDHVLHFVDDLAEPAQRRVCQMNSGHWVCARVCAASPAMPLTALECRRRTGWRSLA